MRTNPPFAQQWKGVRALFWTCEIECVSCMRYNHIHDKEKVALLTAVEVCSGTELVCVKEEVKRSCM